MMIKRIAAMLTAVLLVVELTACETDSTTNTFPSTKPSQTTTVNTTETTENIPLPLSAGQIFTQLSKSTVEILCSHFFNNESSTTASCTGVFIDTDGTILANYNTIAQSPIEGWTEITAIAYDGTEYTVDAIKGYDQKLDIVILATSATNTTPVQFRAASAQTGEKVYSLGAIGNKHGLTFCEGIVTYGTRMINGASYIQHTSAISYTNGALLVDEAGFVIGMESRLTDSTRLMHLATPILGAISIEQNLDLTIAEFLQLAQK